MDKVSLLACLSKDAMGIYMKRLSANDSGETGGHQSGILITLDGRPLLFDQPLSKDLALHKEALVTWELGSFGVPTRCTFHWYPSKNELRVTRFHRHIPHMNDGTHTGSMLVLVRLNRDDYRAFLFSREDEIRRCLEVLGLSEVTLHWCSLSDSPRKTTVQSLIAQYLGVYENFPDSRTMSSIAEDMASWADTTGDPDDALVQFYENEQALFNAFEDREFETTKNRMSEAMTKDEFMAAALTYANRRKSRAGKSLEHHVAKLLKDNGLRFEEQVVTEQKKRPDFIFPSYKSYHDPSFPNDELIMLAAKTSCRDRWRQVTNEADRIETKYLLTLEPGISETQISEMEAAKVRLVIPKAQHGNYSRFSRSRILSVADFIRLAKQIQKQRP